MKKSIFSLLFLLFAGTEIITLGNSRLILGKVEAIEGSAYFVEVGSQAKTMLSAGQAIYEGVTIFTEKKSKVLIRLSNGILKYIPSESKISFISKSLLDTYKKTDSSIQKINTTLGTKASDKNIWIEDEPMLLKTIQKTFSQQKYIETVKHIEEFQGQLSLPEALFIAGFSNFKVGNEKESLFYFEKLIVLKNPQYLENAYFGLFLNYIRLGNLKKAKDIIALFQKENSNHVLLAEMKKILD